MNHEIGMNLEEWKVTKDKRDQLAVLGEMAQMILKSFWVAWKCQKKDMREVAYTESLGLG